MNKYIFMIFSILFSLQAYGQCEKERMLTFIGAGEGKVRIYAIPKVSVEKLPKWSPGNPEPIIGVASAYLLAHKVFQKKKKLGNKSYQLSNIKFAYSSRNNNKIWFYIVIFTESVLHRPPPDQERAFADSNNLVVLLDGTVVTGKVVSEKEFYNRTEGKC